MIGKIVEWPLLFLGVLCVVLLVLAFSAFNFIPSGQLQLFATGMPSFGFGMGLFAVGEVKKISAIKYIAMVISMIALVIVILTFLPL